MKVDLEIYFPEVKELCKWLGKNKMDWKISIASLFNKSNQ